ncbi:FAD-dependent oxidoreductase [Actinomycetospora rhizophila]|uniref:FAD-dependent oxidoreductase n=1 Tax=Actinomycetospora rhizophila TaxID=1416876 RepID=A0ABV9Z564_9PSEU
MTDGPRVVVIGGGIGGLCLAQGLRGAGVPVTVFERDRDPADRWEGYRIHIDPAGARSLRACLPDHLWDALLATSAPGGPFGFVTEQLEELVEIEEAIAYPAAADPAENHYAVDRRTLRRVLLAGLDDVVHLGAEYVSYEHDAQGRPVALFADGRRVTADLLVGADGVGSRVRRQFLPDAEPVPAGVVGIAGKVALTPDVPAVLAHGMHVVSDAGPAALFTAAFRPPPGARAVLAEVTGRPAPPVDEPYLLTALVTTPEHLPPDLDARGPDALAALADDLVRTWHPDLRRLLATSDPASRGASVFLVAPPVPHWVPGRVTLLGDAVHAVPATGGLGGNAALRDARRLTQVLAARPDDLLAAVGAYEADLREHGTATIVDALGVRDQMLAGGVWRTRLSRAWFRLCARSSFLRRRTFAESETEVSRPRPWELTAP